MALQPTDDETLKMKPSDAVVQKLTKWKNEPTQAKLKSDWDAAKPQHDAQMSQVHKWNELMAARTKKGPKNRSTVQPKLIRRQAEWRYSALTEPFVGNSKIFKVTPTTFEDKEAADQNELVLNWQFRTKLNRVKFVDDYVRAAVDEGTVIVRLGWERLTTKIKKEVPTFAHYDEMNEQQADQFKQALELKQENPRGFDESAPEEIKAAVKFYEESGMPNYAEQEGTEVIDVEKVLLNHPTVEVMNLENAVVDPSCNGDIDKAMFVVVSFETNRADLGKRPGTYKNLDAINWNDGGTLTTPDHASTTPDNFNFSDKTRKKIVAYEYWGFYDINGDDTLQPIVATWIGNVMIRMELNPFPDGKLPFVLANYMPKKRELYGEPDAEILEDNQKVLGAVTRGIIDLMGRSANAQSGMAKGMLDAVNKRKFENGEDYEYNPNQNPQIGRVEHKYPEIPQSALAVIQMNNNEAEALTGVKSFAGGVSGEAFGDVAAGIRGVLDASSKREMAILRRLAKGMTDIGVKIISMNAVFMSEKEVVRVTNTEFVTIVREDLQGNFDLEVDISTAEVDNQKSQDLSFMLQTLGPKGDWSLVVIILAEICKLKRMPELAHTLLTYKPAPDPIQQQLAQLQVQAAQKDIEKTQSEIDLNNAKAQEASANKDKKNLDYVEQETGTTHARTMEQQKAQSQGNQNLEVTKALLKPTKTATGSETKPDIDAAVGFNSVSDKLAEGQQAPSSTVDRDVLAGTDPSANLGSMHFDPSRDPSLNPNLNI